MPACVTRLEKVEETATNKNDQGQPDILGQAQTAQTDNTSNQLSNVK
jgi:hypothetical protein